MLFQELNLDPRLLRAVAASGYVTPTEIQKQAVPVAMEGRDLMASAQTGTGKTAVFVLAALQRLLIPPKVQGRGPRVLVLTPTRELALQVTQAVRQLGRFIRLRVGTIVGGVPYEAQEKLLRVPLDFLVATPGRLIDHMQRGRVDCSRVELFVLDEADRMLDMGFIRDVDHIAAAVPKTRQTMLFSATLEKGVQDIARRLLRDPDLIELTQVKQKNAAIQQQVHWADGLAHKQALLAHLLGDQNISQAIIFTATKRGAEQVSAILAAQGHVCAALHGDMTQGARNRTMERMRSGGLRILVATDVAARGLDIRTVSHVINFDLPMTAEDYIHRIGRTGRCGSVGVAISLVGLADGEKLACIEHDMGQSLERKVIPGLEPVLAEPRICVGQQPGFRSACSTGRVFSTAFAPKKRRASGGFGKKDGLRHSGTRKE